MLILFIIYLAVVLWGMKINLRNDSYFTDYLGKEKTASIKGLFILMIMFGHFNAGVNYTWSLDILYVKILAVVGQITVVSFLLYSGYGVMEQIKKKGEGYISTIPQKRMSNVLLEYEISAVFFLLFYFLLGEAKSLGETLSFLLIWGRDWYIFAILFLYISTYIAFKLCKNNKYLSGIVIVALLTVIYILIIKNFRYRYWYDTVLCYPLGMLISLYKEKFEKLTTGKLYKWVMSLLVTGGMSVLMKVMGNGSLLSVILGYLFTGLFIVIVTQRISFHNNMLNWCGVHLFEIFILHRLPIFVLKKVGFTAYNPYVSYIICITVTLVLAYWYKKWYSKLWKLIDKK